jgi:hypothetical protein
MPPWPAIAERVAWSIPCESRLLQASRSPTFGAPPLPSWWHLAHCAFTTCAPLRSPFRSAAVFGSVHLPPDWLTM